MTKITFRPITERDTGFLYHVYTSTREEELMQTGWDATQKATFLKHQFHAQHTYYQQHFTGAKFQVILLNDEPIGRLYIDHRADEIRIIDIALLPEHRGKGIGSSLMRDILAEGQALQLPVRIHVEYNNPAQRLYKRLGFRKIGEHGVHHLMEWVPDSTKSAGSPS